VSSKRSSIGVALVAVLGCVACANTRQVGASWPFVVTDAERARALELIQTQDTFRSLSAEGRTYLVDTQVLRDKANEGERELLVTHYRTEGDMAILSRVNLTRGAVVSVDARPHLAVPLSAAEFERARDLALANERVQKLIGRREVVVESQLSRTLDTEDPLYGHRLVNILLRTPDGYIEARTMLGTMRAPVPA